LNTSRPANVATAIIATATPTYTRGVPDAFSLVIVGVGVVVAIGFRVGVEVVGADVGVEEGFGETVGDIGVTFEVGVGVGDSVGVEV